MTKKQVVELYRVLDYTVDAERSYWEDNGRSRDDIYAYAMRAQKWLLKNYPHELKDTLAAERAQFNKWNNAIAEMEEK
jgi:hypothetical protein